MNFLPSYLRDFIHLISVVRGSVGQESDVNRVQAEDPVVFEASALSVMRAQVAVRFAALVFPQVGHVSNLR